MDTVLELFEAREALKKQVVDLRDHIKKIDDALKERYMDKARTLLSHNGKDFGTVTFHDGNIVIKAFVEKKVEWDQEALARIFDSMPPEEAQHYAKLTLGVEERKYTAAPPHIKSTLEQARTTSVGRFTVEVKE